MLAGGVVAAHRALQPVSERTDRSSRLGRGLPWRPAAAFPAARRRHPAGRTRRARDLLSRRRSEAGGGEIEAVDRVEERRCGGGRGGGVVAGAGRAERPRPAVAGGSGGVQSGVVLIQVCGPARRRRPRRRRRLGADRSGTGTTLQSSSGAV